VHLQHNLAFIIGYNGTCTAVLCVPRIIHIPIPSSANLPKILRFGVSLVLTSNEAVTNALGFYLGNLTLYAITLATAFIYAQDTTASCIFCEL